MFELKIKTGGAAFQDESCTDRHGGPVLDPHATEVRRILLEVTRKLEAGYTYGPVVDVNGNRVGYWIMSDG